MSSRRRATRTIARFGLAVTLLVGAVPVAPVAAAPTSIAFTAEPENEVFGGTPFSIQPVVHVEDGSGPLAGQEVRLSIRPGSGDPQGVLSCSGGLTRITDAGGDAVFAGCAINLEGTGYRLRARAGDILADSGPFTVEPGPAVRLYFVQYPATTTYTRLAPDPIVGTVDAGGNPTPYFRAITLEISKHTSSFSCPEGREQRALNGFAQFKACVQSKIEPGYRLTADDGPGGLEPVTGPVFDIAAAAPTQLQVCWGPPPTCSEVPPRTSTGGAELPIQPRVRIIDQNGNLAVLDNSTPVTLAIAPGTPETGGPGELTCASGLTVTASAGTANFHGCRIRQVGTGYRLRATAANLAAGTSNPFSVAPGPPVRIGFVDQPAFVVVNEPFGAVVAIQDAGGNTVSTGASALIRLALGNNPGATGFTCDLNEVRTEAGVAAFTGCRINIRAGGFTLNASALDAEPAVAYEAIQTRPFRAVDAAADITLSASQTVITWGESVQFDLRIATRGAGRPVRLEASADRRTWTTVASGTTDSQGRARVPITLDRNRWYRVAFDGSSDLGEGTSNEVRVVVRQIALLRPTNPGRTTTIRSGDLVRFTTTVRPARDDLPRPRVRYVVYRLSGNAWRLSLTRDVTADASGRASIELSLAVGRWYVRSQALPTSANANSTWSPVEWYEVVPLAAT